MSKDPILSSFAAFRRSNRPNKITIVEDHPDWLENLIDILSDRGYELETRRSNLRGNWGEKPPNVVIIGTTVSDEEKCEIYEDLRSSPAVNPVGVIFLVNDEKKSKKVKSLELREDDYIIEPNFVSPIRRCVAQIISSQSDYDKMWKI